MNDAQNRCVACYALLLALLVVSIPQAMANKSHTTRSTSAADTQGGLLLWDSPYGYDWADMHPAARYDLIELAEKGGDSKGKYSHGKRDKPYQDLTPEQRETLHQRREDFKSLPPEERERIQKAREKFHNMPSEERQKLKDKWRSMTPEERERAYKNKKNHKRRD
jgi:DNA-binding PadR family transcriptional regulator